MPGSELVVTFDTATGIRKGRLIGTTLIEDKAVTSAKLAEAGIGARVYRTAALSVADDILTYVPFDAERYDTDNIHDNVTNPDRLTCKTAGVYIITASVGFDVNDIGSRMAEIHHSGLAKNIVTGRTPAYATVYTHLCLATVCYMDVDDYVRLRVMQDSGGALDLMAFPNCSEFAIQRII